MKQIIIFLIQQYKKLVSPFLGSCCRFYPSCSEYAEEAIKKKGLFQGVWKASLRVLRCHPFHPGGIDAV